MMVESGPTRQTAFVVSALVVSTPVVSARDIGCFEREAVAENKVIASLRGDCNH